MAVLSRKADYALLILSCLNRRDEGANARLVAEEVGLSHAYVSNILKELCREGYVVSSRGVKGGYLLAEGVEARSLAELLTAIGEDFHLTLCSGADVECELHSHCAIKEPLVAVHQRIVAILAETKLGRLLVNRPVGTLSLPVVASSS